MSELSHDTGGLEEPTRKQQIASLVWQQFVHPELVPKPQHQQIAENANPVTGKTRGRPRKYLPAVQGKTVHRMSDSEEPIRKLRPETIHKVILDFKEYLDEGKTAREAMEEIAKLYAIPYSQAYMICHPEC